MMVTVVELVVVVMVMFELQHHSSPRERYDQDNQRHRTPYDGAECANSFTKKHGRDR